MSTLGSIIAASAPIDGGFVADIPSGWMQGRTAYGGLSAALALEAARRCDPGLPPLRSCQIAFVAPLAGRVAVTATLLRRGRTAAFVQADISGEAGLGLRANFVFMAEQPSTIVHDGRAGWSDAAPAPDTPAFVGPPENFTGNFEFVDMKEGRGPVELRRWARLRDREGLAPSVELMAIADGLPPAALRLLRDGFAPLSTLSWSLNLLTPVPSTTDGWWLLAATADVAGGGYSSQHMSIWNAAGECVAHAIQSVVIFA